MNNLSSELRRSKTPPRMSPVPRPPSAPVHHERTQHTPHTPHLSPKKETFNNLLNKGVTGPLRKQHQMTGTVIAPGRRPAIQQNPDSGNPPGDVSGRWAAAA
ncbi:hypothetical protein ACJJTC_010223 [Scirpophaga incertulas]